MLARLVPVALAPQDCLLVMVLNPVTLVQPCTRYPARGYRVVATVPLWVQLELRKWAVLAPRRLKYLCLSLQRILYRQSHRYHRTNSIPLLQAFLKAIPSALAPLCEFLPR